MASNGIHNGQANNLLGHDGHLPVHTFDPDAPPSEKAAIAGRERGKLDSVAKNQDSGAQELQPQGGGSMVPTITIQDIDEEKEKSSHEAPEESTNEKADIPQTPPSPTATVGEFPTVPAHTIPDWYRIGWRQVSGIDAPLPEGEEKDRNVLDLFISEQYYGTWYHNAGIIIFAVISTHFLTLFRFGWGWLFIVLSVCSTYYTVSVRRVRRIARDEIQRELVKSRLESEHEPAEWLNNFLDRFWLMYEPVLSASIVASVEPILIASTPTFLDSLRLTHFTLGAKAPHIDKVRTFPKTEEDIVMMDLSLSFTPKDTSNMTPEQRASKDNMKIVLAVRFGKGLATATMPILVENLTFSGILRVRMKLISNWPHVQTVDLSFMEQPFIDYILKPLGGDTFGFDIANLPGLSSFIRDMTHGTLQPMMYHPNLFTLNLEQMMSGVPLDTACGIIQVTVQSARGIKGVKVGGGTPDPYVGLSINNQKQLASTKYKTNTYNPTWMETKYLLVHDLNGTLNLNLWDFNDHRKDTLLGSATFELNRLIDDATQDAVTTQILKDGKDRGEMRYDVIYYPVLQPEEGKEVPDTHVGIARITIHQAKELDSSGTLSGDLNPFVKLYIGDGKKAAYTTSIFKHTKNPTWETAYEFLCSDKSNTVITIKVVDDRDFLKDPIIGYMSIRLQDLLDSMADPKQDWFPLSHCRTGKIRLSAMWKPLSITGSLHGAEQYTPPIGVVRLLLDKATDVKNVEATLGGKSDPYVRVQINNITQGRTEVINNNLNPVWDQIVYIPVHSLKEIMILECMDYQHLTKDRTLGSVELLVSDLAEASDDPHYPFKSKGVKDAEEGLRLEGNKYHGTLHYVANFIPAVLLKNFKFTAQKHGLQRDSEDSQDEEGGYVETGSVASEDDHHKVDGPTIKLSRRRSQAGVRVEKIPEAPETNGVNGANGATNSTEDSSSTASSGKEAEPPAKKEEPGVELSVEELLNQQSGIVIFNIVSGNLSKKARLEVLLDDGYWPCFTTPKPRSVHAQWQHVGEGFVKEIDFSQVWLRLNDAPEGDKDDVIAQWKGETKPFLEEALKGPKTYTLINPDTEAKSTVTIEARYVPVPVQLQPRESINNQGLLRVELIDGQEIRGVDRGGKSDPYVVFALNGQKVHKSQTKKKTLHPEWNEDFTCVVPSRVAADFTVEVFDWNQIEQAKSLGTGVINLADLEPFQASDRIVPLSTTKHGEKGHIRIRLVFQPEIIAKTRKNTSTFTSAGRAMTQIGALPVSAGRGVFHGVTSVFKSKPKDDDAGSIVSVSSDAPAGQASQPSPPVMATDFAPGQHVAASAPLAAFPSSEHVHVGNEPGTLRVTVMSAKDLPPEYKPYAVLRLGDKEVKTKHTGKTSTPEWNESFSFYAGPGQAKLHLWIHDHKALGRDKVLGEGEVDIWRHIQPEGVSSADVYLDLRNGTGLVRLKLEYDASLHPSASNGSAHTGERMTRTTSITSPSRFSLRNKRPGSDD